MIRFCAVWGTLLALVWGQASYGQVADSSAASMPDSAAHFDVMFLAEPGDTLIFTRDPEYQVFAQRDSVEIITEEDVYDTLDFRTFIPGTPPELIEDRLSCLVGEMPLTYNRTVNSFINFFVVRKRGYTQTMLERRDFFFPIFEEALRRYQLPDELKYLAIVESGLNMRAVSKSGAVGLWQFMGPTGRDFRLNQDKYLDDRMDPHKSTEAACRYLRFLYNQFNDWELALAAYNCGPGAIRRTMNRMGGRTFWEIYASLPQETRSYVPQFTAVMYAMNYAQDHNLYADADSLFTLPKKDTVVLYQQVSLAALSRHLQVDPKQLLLLNPTIRKSFSPEQVPFTLNLPQEAALRFRAERQCFMDSCIGTPKQESQIASRYGPRRGEARSDKGTPVLRTYHKVRKGENLYSVAMQYGLTAKELRKWNHLRSPKVKVGQKLIVLLPKPRPDAPIKSLADESKSVVKKTKGTTLPLVDSADGEGIKGEKEAPLVSTQSAKAKGPAKKRGANKTESKATTSEKEDAVKAIAPSVYEVQAGDTLWNIARRFQGLTVERLMSLNRLKDKNLKVGMKLVLS